MCMCGSHSPPNSPQGPTPPPSTNNPPARKKAAAWVLEESFPGCWSDGGSAIHQRTQDLGSLQVEVDQGVVVDDESVWSEFASKHHEAVWVGRAGFPCFELMSSLMPSAVRGTHIYKVSTLAYGTGMQSGQGSDQGPVEL
ncbi:hypothetical protein K439DRAFT_1624324 [Ramaria rubella]|nr:hypothetical protein K439DRAFT_1624788 [Ramaria rubella]KAF8574429.1 hypothetical protein K439DRAFT_1624324 [Ramaria rubella]